ncbi:MAG: hypothetical protein HY453_00265 [Parcubacteria group bacterium]|nr:hypothetical protein [Parcubacteria group bacterium]
MKNLLVLVLILVFSISPLSPLFAQEENPVKKANSTAKKAKPSESFEEEDEGAEEETKKKEVELYRKHFPKLKKENENLRRRLKEFEREMDSNILEVSAGSKLKISKKIGSLENYFGSSLFFGDLPVGLRAQVVNWSARSDEKKDFRRVSYLGGISLGGESHRIRLDCTFGWMSIVQGDENDEHKYGTSNAETTEIRGNLSFHLGNLGGLDFSIFGEGFSTIKIPNLYSWEGGLCAGKKSIIMGGLMAGYSHIPQATSSFVLKAVCRIETPAFNVFSYAGFTIESNPKDSGKEVNFFLGINIEFFFRGKRQ